MLHGGVAGDRLVSSDNYVFSSATTIPPLLLPHHQNTVVVDFFLFASFSFFVKSVSLCEIV
jgi:hypothetical protein